MKVQITENDKVIWGYDFKKKAGISNRNYIKDGTIYNIKISLEKTLEYINQQIHLYNNPNKLAISNNSDIM
jgi:hypothetical protein